MKYAMLFMTVVLSGCSNGYVAVSDSPQGWIVIPDGSKLTLVFCKAEPTPRCQQPIVEMQR